MDIFSACVAFGPLAIYLLLLGMINISPRPLVVSGTRETLAIGLAVMGLVVIGPLQLFMPQEAAARFDGLVWILLVGFYVLSLLLVIMLGRPRLVVYNMTLDELLPILAETAARLDHDSCWAGKALNMPQMRVNLQLEGFTPMRNVTLSATHDEQSIGGWRRLAAALRVTLRKTKVSNQTHGLRLVLCGLLILLTLAMKVAEQPQMVAQGLSRLLHP
ncbi:MAG TPA: hypothetical protein VGZ26_08620 [Pirellulales bacterium]|nr:hypothetical protein [Pirellulales bacterium]